MAFLSVAQINIVAAAATVCNIYGWKKQQEKENRFRWNNGHGNKSAHWWRPNLMLCVFISLTNLHPFACFFFFFCVLCGGFLLSVWNTFAPMWMFSSFMIAFEADRCMRKWATEREWARVVDNKCTTMSQYEETILKQTERSTTEEATMQNSMKWNPLDDKVKRPLDFFSFILMAWWIHSFVFFVLRAIDNRFQLNGNSNQTAEIFFKFILRWIRFSDRERTMNPNNGIWTAYQIHYRWRSDISYSSTHEVC